MPESFLGTQGSGASLSVFIFLSLVVSKFEFSLGAFGVCFMGRIRSSPKPSLSHRGMPGSGDEAHLDVVSVSNMPRASFQTQPSCYPGV